MTPKFSVILSVCHGGKFLAQALASLTCVSSPPGGFEVVVAGGQGEVSRLPGFFSDQTDWQALVCEGNRSAKLNAACASARGSVWIFSDDDCIFSSDWLLNVERSLTDHSDASVLGGTDILASGAGDFDLALDVVLNSFIGTGGTRTPHLVKAGTYYPKLWNMTVVACAAKRAALDAPDEKLIFDPSLFVHEDVDFINRIRKQGGKVVSVFQVCVQHYRRTDFFTFLKRNMAMAQTCKRRGIHRVAHWGLVALFLGVPVVAALSAVIPELLAISIAGGYGATVFLIGFKGAMAKNRARLLLWIPALIVSMHAARAFGFISAFYPGYKKEIGN